MNKIEGEEAMELFEIVRKQGCLPTKIDELVPISFIGQAAVSFYRQTVKAMKHLDITEEQRRATLKDGQDAGEMLLDIEARIGELAASTPNGKPGPKTKDPSPTGSGSPKHERIGIDRKKMHQSQQIAKHPEIVERVKAKARENEDIPTKTAVLSEISKKKLKEKIKKDAKIIRELNIEKRQRSQLPDINEYVGIVVADMHELENRLGRLDGQIGYITDKPLKLTLKTQIDSFIAVAKRVRKEF